MPGSIKENNLAASTQKEGEYRKIVSLQRSGYKFTQGKYRGDDASTGIVRRRDSTVFNMEGMSVR
jgi:hypothetical protein